MNRAKKQKRAKRHAARVPARLLDVGTTKASGWSKWKGRQSKWGAASEVRHIDPAEYIEGKK